MSATNVIVLPICALFVMVGACPTRADLGPIHKYSFSRPAQSSIMWALLYGVLSDKRNHQSILSKHTVYSVL